MTHPLSTARLIERAATGNDTDPDYHHVEVAYRIARATAIVPADDDHTAEMAADVAALDLALATCAALARRIYDHPANGGPAELSDWLYRILGHYAADFDRIMGDLERLADTDHAAAS